MTIDTVTGSTPSGSLVVAARRGRPTARRTCAPRHKLPRSRGAISGGAGGQPHGVAVLAVPDDLARDRCLAAHRAAQLAEDPVLAPGVEMNQLAGQRRASAVRAAVPVGLEGAQPAPQQTSLKLLYVVYERCHDPSDFATPCPAPPRR